MTVDGNNGADLYIDGNYVDTAPLESGGDWDGFTATNTYLGGEINNSRRYYEGELDHLISDRSYWSSNYATTEYGSKQKTAEKKRLSVRSRFLLR